jgi:hypothetical protein
VGATVVVGASVVVVVVAGGVVSATVVLEAGVVSAGCVTLGGVSLVFDGSPHETAARPSVLSRATLRAMLMCEVLPSRGG